MMQNDPRADSRVHLTRQEQKAYTVNIHKFYLYRLFVNFQLWLPIWVLYLQLERGLSLTQITVMDAPFWILMVVMEVPTGAVADRWGRKISLLLGTLIYSIAIFIFGMANSFSILLLSYMIWAISWTLISGADAAFFYDSLRALGREEEYQKLWGRVRAVQATGAVLGLLFGAPLAAATNLWVPVVVSAGLIAIGFIIALSFTEPPRYTEGEEPLSYLDGTRQAFRIAFGLPAVRTLLMLAATVTAIATSISILVQPFLISHSVRVVNFGWFLVPGQLLAIVASLYAFHLSAAIGAKRVLMLLPLSVLVTAIVLGNWDSVVAFLFYPVIAMVLALSFPVISDYLNRRIPSSQRATILSIYSLMFSLVICIMEPLLGAIADYWTLLVAYNTGAIILGLVSAPLLIFWLKALRDEQPAIPLEDIPESVQKVRDEK